MPVRIGAEMCVLGYIMCADKRASSKKPWVNKVWTTLTVNKVCTTLTVLSMLYCQQRKFRKHFFCEKDHNQNPPSVDGHILRRISENLSATVKGVTCSQCHTEGPPSRGWHAASATLRAHNMERHRTELSGPPAVCAPLGINCEVWISEYRHWLRRNISHLFFARGRGWGGGRGVWFTDRLIHRWMVT